MSLNNEMILNYEMETMRKKVVVVYFKILSLNSHSEIEWIQENLQRAQSIPAGFETGLVANTVPKLYRLNQLARHNIVK
jgi:hypothetical protein